MMRRRRVGGVLLVLFWAFALLLPTPARADGERIAVLGANLTPEEWVEISDRFDIDPEGATATATMAEIVAALRGSGLPAFANEESIASSMVTCRSPGQGLAVRTEHITRMTSPTYAGALLLAGLGDAEVLVAAPSARPVTGESALVGILRAAVYCVPGQTFDAERVKLAYEHMSRTLALGTQLADLHKAGAFMLKGTQQVLARRLAADGVIGAALDAAAATEGIQVPAAQRTELIAYFRKVARGDRRAGFQVEQLMPSDVRLRVYPVAPAQPAPPPVAPAVTTFTGTVERAGPAPLVRTQHPDWQGEMAPDLVVTRNGQPAELADLAEGDTVTVTMLPDGSAQRIDATSGSARGGTRWLALVGLLAVLGPLFVLVRRRRHEPFILEPRPVGTTVDRRSRLRL